MKKTLITTSIIAALMAMPAVADPTAQELLDQKTVTSKYYVDTTKQDKITTDKVLLYDEDNDADDVYVPAIVTTNAAGTALDGSSMGIMDSENSDGFYNESIDRDNFVPTVAAVAGEINGLYDDVEHHIQSVANDIDTKQNKMTCAGYVPGHENDRNYCWLYGEVQVACKAAGVECTNTNECCSELSCFTGKGESTTKCW